MGVWGYKVGTPVMLQLGEFQFGINTAAFQEMARTNEWRWPAQDRFGLPPVLQYIGEGAETITLPGLIYPEWRGGFTQVANMREQAAKGEPLQMVAGDGAMLGLFVIEGVDEKQSIFADAGAPRKQEFTLKLRRFYYAGAKMPTVPAVTGAPGNTRPDVGVPASATGAVSKATGLAKSVSERAKGLTATISKAYDTVQSKVAPYTAIAADAAGAVMRVADVADEMQTTANRLLAVVGQSPIDVTAISAVQTMAGKAGRLLVAADSAGALLRASTSRLEQLSGVSRDAVQATRSAAATADQCAIMCRQTVAAAATISE